MSIRLIAIGTSAGGVTAIQRLMALLPKDFRIPLVVVQHLPSNPGINLSLVFGSAMHFPVFEAVDKLAIEAGTVYFAPPGYHLLVEKDQTFSLSQDEPVHFSRPSIDVFFEAAANAYGTHLCGVLLTGANADGAEGLRLIAQQGGVTLVQDPLDAEVNAMPRAALALFQPHFVGSLTQIAHKLTELARGSDVC
ncbi:MAG: chemotaxis protein CheB [Bdellovibrionales bacterium]|nr:chemotaxis protein CheB [Bdellovibrionales bacterium]